MIIQQGKFLFSFIRKKQTGQYTAQRRRLFLHTVGDHKRSNNSGLLIPKK